MLVLLVFVLGGRGTGPGEREEGERKGKEVRRGLEDLWARRGCNVCVTLWVKRELVDA